MRISHTGNGSGGVTVTITGGEDVVLFSKDYENMTGAKEAAYHTLLRIKAGEKFDAPQPKKTPAKKAAARTTPAKKAKA